MIAYRRRNSRMISKIRVFINLRQNVCQIALLRDYIISDVLILYLYYILDIIYTRARDSGFEIKLNISIFHESNMDDWMCAVHVVRTEFLHTFCLQMKCTLLFTLVENNRINTPFKPKAKHSPFEHIMLLRREFATRLLLRSIELSA